MSRSLFAMDWITQSKFRILTREMMGVSIFALLRVLLSYNAMPEISVDNIIVKGLSRVDARPSQNSSLFHLSNTFTHPNNEIDAI